MGQWAENALNRFNSEASEQRRSEELELVRHNKLQAGAEKTWKSLQQFLVNETKDFNSRLGREFFSIENESPHVIKIDAPQGSARCELDLRVPEIWFVHPNPLRDLGSESKKSELLFVLRQGKTQQTAVMVDQNGIETTPEIVGAQILNPLVA